MAAAVERIIGDFERHSQTCRQAFLYLFHYRANAAAFMHAVQPSLDAETAAS
jgi:hypothetical protein